MTEITLKEKDDLKNLFIKENCDTDIIVSIDFQRFKSSAKYTFKKDNSEKGFLMKNSTAFFELGYENDDVYLKSLLMGIDISKS